MEWGRRYGEEPNQPIFIRRRWTVGNHSISWIQQYKNGAWNEMTKPDKGIHQLPPYQLHVPSGIEGPGIEFSFDEVCSNELAIKNDFHPYTDGEPKWQVQKEGVAGAEEGGASPDNDGGGCTPYRSDTK